MSMQCSRPTAEENQARRIAAARRQAGRISDRDGLRLGRQRARLEAVARIFAAKGRPHTSPIIVHVSSLEMARLVVAEWPPSSAVALATEVLAWAADAGAEEAGLPFPPW